MTTANKKKKKSSPSVQTLEKPEQQQLAGSADYIANREIDQIIKKGKDKLKHAITISDEKLTKTKKLIVREIAAEMEHKGYPINQICDRLSKSYKGLVSDRTVRDALDAKYKDAARSAEASAQNHDSGKLYHYQEQVAKKPLEEITLDDIKVLSATKAKQLATYLKKRKDMLEYNMSDVQQQHQQDKQQNKQPPEYEMNLVSDFNLVLADKEKIIADSKKENTRLERAVKSAQDLFMEVIESGLSDEEMGREIRKRAKAWGFKVAPKSKPNLDDSKK